MAPKFNCKTFRRINFHLPLTILGSFEVIIRSNAFEDELSILEYSLMSSANNLHTEGVSRRSTMSFTNIMKKRGPI